MSTNSAFKPSSNCSCFSLIVFGLVMIVSDAKAVNPDQFASKIDKDVNVLTAHLSDNVVIKTEISVGAYRPRYIGEIYTHDSWWGAPQSSPKTIIKDLKVEVNDAGIKLLPCTFDYLGNPTKIAIVPIEHGFLIKLFGGDAGGAYIATFEFLGQTLTRKRVQSAEFPDEVYEETQYVNQIDLRQ